MNFLYTVNNGITLNHIVNLHNQLSVLSKMLMYCTI